MLVVFRVDASPEIGTGHLYRCLTLADALARNGAQCHFIMRGSAEFVRSTVQSRGHDFHGLPSREQAREKPEGPPHATWLGARWLDDVRDTATIARTLGQPDWLIIDHYGIDERWESESRGWARRIMVVDDLADRRHDCDLLLDQNPTVGPNQRYAQLVPPDCECLLGPRYALLRPEFGELARCAKDRTASPRQLLVFFGGADGADLTSPTMNAIEALAPEGVRVSLVLGAANKKADTLARQYGAKDWVRVYRQADMAELIGEADLAIGAAGVTAIERMAGALPSIIVSIAENQESGAVAIGRLGAGLYLGRAQEVTQDAIAHALSTLTISPTLRDMMASRAKSLVDGVGAERVARELCAEPVRIRHAVAADCDDIWRWRNHEETRRHFNDPAPVDLADHRNWFASNIDHPDTCLLVGTDSAGPVGVVRFDKRGDVRAVSIYVVPGRVGGGAGRRLLRASIGWLRQEDPGARVVEAQILETNGASQAMFARAGFSRWATVYRFGL